uniref:Uncharacterized protein n=1 Tax=Opuntia streptacantha TaxID=393608 RepID=A0A7C8ZWX3_OPUST
MWWNIRQHGDMQLHRASGMYGQYFFLIRKNMILILLRIVEIDANWHLTKDYVLCTPHIQAVEHKKQLKRGGAKLSALPKIKSLHNYIFQILERNFNPLESSSITLPPNTPKNNMR